MYVVRTSSNSEPGNNPAAAAMLLSCVWSTSPIVVVFGIGGAGRFVGCGIVVPGAMVGNGGNVGSVGDVMGGMVIAASAGATSAPIVPTTATTTMVLIRVMRALRSMGF